jgi:soluble lytic murein transglycosylase-like protein
LKNKVMAICLYALTVAAALPLRAADPGSLRPAAQPPLTSTVKASPASGRLVRSVVIKRPSGASAHPTVPAEIQRLVESAAAHHHVDPLLVHSVMKVESNFNPEAVSPKGAMGLMQLMPATARRFGAGDAFDARQNIEAGVKYLRFLKDTFQDDRLALAAYNAGEGAVLRHGGIPPYKETREYVEKVGRRYQDARARLQSPPQSAPPTAPAEPPLRSVELFTDPEGRVHLRTRN